MLLCLSEKVCHSFGLLSLMELMQSDFGFASGKWTLHTLECFKWRILHSQNSCILIIISQEWILYWLSGSYCRLLILVKIGFLNVKRIHKISSRRLNSRSFRSFVYLLAKIWSYIGLITCNLTFMLINNLIGLYG